MPEFDVAECREELWGVTKRHTRIASRGVTFYHFTGMVGFEGILRSGHLRASHRSHMNDDGEFKYGLDLILGVIRKEMAESDSTAEYQHFLAILEQFILDYDSTLMESSYAYCGCVTSHSDDEAHWRDYCGMESGFAIGVDLQSLFESQKALVDTGKPFLVWVPVSYDVEFQECVARDFLRTSFPHWLSEKQSSPNMFIGRIRKMSEVEKELVAPLLMFLNSIKDQKYMNERELRVFKNPNNGNFKPDKVYSDTGSNRRFTLLNFCNPDTGRIPLTEVVVGPMGESTFAMEFADCLLRDLGYLSGTCRPRLRFSSNV